MQVRSFVFTLNNYTDAHIDAIKDHFNDARYIIIGKEVGDSGTPHLQGFIQLLNRRTLQSIGGLFPWHVEPTKGTPLQAATYCKKGGDFIEVGQLREPSLGKEKKEDYWKQILELAKNGQMVAIEEAYPGEYIRNFKNLHNIRVENLPHAGTEKKCLWLYGKPGCGKSRFAFGLNPDSTYPKMANKWWCGYKDQTVIVLDDFGKDHRVLGYHLKRWADRYPAVLEVKGSSIPTTYDTFVITSNYSIEEIWDGDEETIAAINRRFKSLQVISHHVDPVGLLTINCFDKSTETIIPINYFNLWV